MTKRFIFAGIILLIFVFGVSVFHFLPKGKSEFFAIDNNSNGIWDDYEKILNEKYKNTPNIKNAAFQTGKILQDLLDPSDIMKKDKAFAKAMSCLVAAGLHDGLSLLESTDLINQVRDIVISNDARQAQYIKYNAEVSGKMLTVEMPDISNCEFLIEGSTKSSLQNDV